LLTSPLSNLMPGLIAGASIDDIQIPGFNENVCRYQKKKKIVFQVHLLKKRPYQLYFSPLKHIETIEIKTYLRKNLIR